MFFYIIHNLICIYFSIYYLNKKNSKIKKLNSDNFFISYISKFEIFAYLWLIIKKVKMVISN